MNDVYQVIRNLLDVRETLELYQDAIGAQWIDDAIAMLKAQEPVEPYLDFDGGDVWGCGNCHWILFHPNHTQDDNDEKNYRKYCFHCGRAMKWNG